MRDSLGLKRATMLDQLWHQHLAAAYPTESTDLEVVDVDPVLIDSAIAGCVDTYLKTGALDTKRRQVLTESVRELETLMPRLTGEAHLYFDRLKRMGDIILRET